MMKPLKVSYEISFQYFYCKSFSYQKYFSFLFSKDAAGKPRVDHISMSGPPSVGEENSVAFKGPPINL